MSATVQKLFAPLTLNGAGQTVYTVPDANVLEHFRVRVTNIDSSSHTITLYAVPSGGSPATANTCIPTETLGANSHTDFDIPVLQSNDFLSALSDDANHLVITGIEGILYTDTTQFVKLFAPFELATSAMTVYTVPVGNTIERFRVRVANTDGSNRTFTMYAVTSGGTPGAANTFIHQETVNANSHTDLDVPTLQGGDFLSALASVGSVVTIHGLDGILFS